MTKDELIEKYQGKVFHLWDDGKYSPSRHYLIWIVEVMTGEQAGPYITKAIEEYDGSSKLSSEFVMRGISPEYGCHQNIYIAKSKDKDEWSVIPTDNWCSGSIMSDEEKNNDPQLKDIDTCQSIDIEFRNQDMLDNDPDTLFTRSLDGVAMETLNNIRRVCISVDDCNDCPFMKMLDDMVKECPVGGFVLDESFCFTDAHKSLYKKREKKYTYNFKQL